MTMDPKLYYTVPEICKILNLSSQTIWRYIKKGQLEGTKIGRQYYITVDSLNNLLANGTRTKK